jgi:hypothetical protein
MLLDQIGKQFDGACRVPNLPQQLEQFALSARVSAVSRIHRSEQDIGVPNGTGRGIGCLM